MVKEFLNNNESKRAPHNKSNTNRLQGNGEIDHLITMEEIKRTIKLFRTVGPGETQINKTIHF